MSKSRVASFHAEERHLELLRRFAYWERMSIKQAIAEIFEEFFRNRSLRAIPKSENFLTSCERKGTRKRKIRG